MPYAVIALRESRLVWRLTSTARFLTCIVCSVLAVYGEWAAAGAALLIFVLGWTRRSQINGSLSLGEPADCQFRHAQNVTSAHAGQVPAQAIFESAYDGFGLLILKFRGKVPGTVIVAPDTTLPELRRQIGLWLKKTPAKANSGSNVRS